MLTTSTNVPNTDTPAHPGECRDVPVHSETVKCHFVSKIHMQPLLSLYLSVPRYDQPPPPPVTYQPRPPERNQPVLVPANPYHTAEIPDWLQVYARAPLK